MDLVSIIVPIYKVEEYLEECILSIVNQTYKNIEIILVDDGSPDRCGLICDEWAQKDDRIRVIHKENGGLSDARNAGIAAAYGEYLAFVDSDDYISPDYVRLMLANIGDAEMCCCNYVAFAGEIQKQYPVPDMVLSEEEYWGQFGNKELSQYLIVAWNKLYKRDLWNKIRYPIGKVHEDRFALPQILEQCNTIVCLSVPLYHYRYRAGSITTQRALKSEYDDFLAFQKQIEYLCRKKYSIALEISMDSYRNSIRLFVNNVVARGLLTNNVIRRILSELKWIDEFCSAYAVNVQDFDSDDLVSKLLKSPKSVLITSKINILRNFVNRLFNKIRNRLKN